VLPKLDRLQLHHAIQADREGQLAAAVPNDMRVIDAQEVPKAVPIIVGDHVFSARLPVDEVGAGGKGIGGGDGHQIAPENEVGPVQQAPATPLA
jgi:hypothetical protein